MRAQDGYSLLELLITLSIAAILLQLGMGDLSNLSARAQQRNTTQAIVDTIERARRLAVTTQWQMIVCPLAAENTCGENWSSGAFAVFLDTNRNRKQDEGDVLQLQQPRRSAQQIQISWSNWLRDSTITFRGDGSVASNGTLTLRRTARDDPEEIIALLVINKGGRLRIDTPK